MAFIDDSDRQPKAEAVARAPARRSVLVPVLLGVLIFAIFILAAVEVVPLISGSSEDPAAEAPDLGELISRLDPESLVTPTGRSLELVEFGGRVFEITLIAWGANPKLRSVAITVPALPPMQGRYHIGESFDRGRIRIKDIGKSFVVLVCEGEQQTFPVLGSDPGAIWDAPSPSGTVIMPARGDETIPSADPGRVRAPRDPREAMDQSEGDAENAGTRVSGLDDLPDYRRFRLERKEYLQLVRDLPELFKKQFVLASALEEDSRVSFGLEIKNVKPACIFVAYGLQKGDVIVRINDDDIRSVPDLDMAVSRQSFRWRIEIVVWRNEDFVYYLFEPGKPG